MLAGNFLLFLLGTWRAFGFMHSKCVALTPTFVQKYLQGYAHLLKNIDIFILDSSINLQKWSLALWRCPPQSLEHLQGEGSWE